MSAMLARVLAATPADSHSAPTTQHTSAHGIVHHTATSTYYIDDVAMVELTNML